MLFIIYSQNIIVFWLHKENSNGHQHPLLLGGVGLLDLFHHKPGTHVLLASDLRFI